MAKQAQGIYGAKGQSDKVAPLPLDQLPDSMRQFVKDLPKDKRNEAAVLFYSSMKSHSGPLPSPETLEGYNQVLPGLADRIVTMAENQQKHRVGLENTSLRRQFNQSGTGQWMAFVLSILFLGVGGYLIHEDHDWAGSIIITGTLVSLAVAFITGKLKIAQSLNQKA